MDDIDIFSEESMFRDPVYEEMGFIFDPERNEYFEMVDDSEHGRIRSYIPPRDVAVQRSIEKSRVGRIYGPGESPFDNREVTVGDRVRDLLFQKQIERSDRLDEYERQQEERLKERERKRQSQSFQSGGAVENIDIFDDPNRDPVYEDMGFSFDNERGQYFEVVSHPEHGVMRRYISPRDQSPVPALSDARDKADIRRLIASVAGSIGGKAAGRVSGKEFEIMKSGSKGLTKGRGYKEGGGVGDIDIFEPSNPAPPVRAEYIPPQRFDQLQQFAEDPQGFSSNEAVTMRYEQGRQDILNKREQGGYGSGDNFDREAYQRDYQNLNKALDMGMPARIFPAFTPYTAREADMAAEITQYEGVPTPEQQAAEQILARTSADRALERKITDLDPFGRRVQEIAGGVGSLLGRFGGTSDEKQLILREEAKGPEIKLFRQEARRGMPSQTGVTFTRRF